MSLLLRAGEDWVDIQSPSIVVGGQQVQVVRGEVFTGGKWVRFFPHEETTTLTVTSDLSGLVAVGVGRVVEGVVTPASGGIAGGTVTIESRQPGGAWQEIGEAQVAPAAGPASWGVTATPTECGPHEFRAVYSGTPVNGASETAVSTITVGLAAPAKPTGGAIGDTTLALSWPAVPGATAYEVRRDGLLVADQPGLSFADSGLSPATAYSYRVTARRGQCGSVESPALVGTTSRSTVQDAGSDTITVAPLKTNSYRPSDGWGYISANVGQGYYTSASNNYTGVIDFGPNADFKAKIAAALGPNGAQRVAHLTITKAEVYLYKQTGVGSAGAVNASFYVSTAEAGVGGLPARSGSEVVVASTASGSAKWYDIGVAHAQALLAGTARSIALFKSATSAYLRFSGKGVNGADSCSLRLAVSWDYLLSSAAPGGWA